MEEDVSSAARECSLNNTHPESPEYDTVPRIRILCLHMSAYLFRRDSDYLYSIQFLRNYLDMLEDSEEYKRVRYLKGGDGVTKLQDLLTQETEPGKVRETDSNEDEVNRVINQCLDSELSDYEMSRKLDGSSCSEEEVPIKESSRNPLYVWQFMYDPDDHNISQFIEPLQTSNYGLVVKLMIAFGITAKSYDARLRTFTLAVSQLLKIDYPQFQAYELAAVDTLQDETCSRYKKKKERMSVKGMAAVGLAATGGAVLMTLTGGLAAPFVVSGLATIVGTSTTAFLATTTGLAAIAATFGAVGGGLTGYKVGRLVGSIDQFEFARLKEQPSLAITILVHGLYRDEKEPQSSWETYTYTGEQYILLWETTKLVQFTSALFDFIKDTAIALAADEVVKFTVFSALASSLAWPVTLMSLTSIIDNPWSVIMKRSKAVGIHLAAVLARKLHGERPVSLVGYGLGARVVFFCLLELATRYPAEVYSGILENAVLCGAPVTSHTAIWRKICCPVSGKVVNVFSTHDWVLSFLYKTSRVTKRVAGISAVNLDNRKMVNVDVSSIIKGHTDYPNKMGDILKIIGMGR